MRGRGLVLLPLLLLLALLAAGEEPGAKEKVVAKEKWLGKGVEQWGSRYHGEKKIGWEQHTLSADEKTNSLLLITKLHYATAGQERDMLIKTRLSAEGDLKLLGYELYLGAQKMAEGSVEKGKFLFKEVDGEALSFPCAPESITSYGLWVWALAMPLVAGQERPVALFEEGKGQTALKGTLRVVGREKVTLEKGPVEAWKLEAKRGGEEGYCFWLDDEHRMLQASCDGIIIRRETAEQAAKASLEK